MHFDRRRIGGRPEKSLRDNDWLMKRIILERKIRFHFSDASPPKMRDGMWDEIGLFLRKA
jgi:hypothetical protein